MYLKVFEFFSVWIKTSCDKKWDVRERKWELTFAKVSELSRNIRLLIWINFDGASIWSVSSNKHRSLGQSSNVMFNHIVPSHCIFPLLFAMYDNVNMKQYLVQNYAPHGPHGQVHISIGIWYQKTFRNLQVDFEHWRQRWLICKSNTVPFTCKLTVKGSKMVCSFPGFPRAL